MLVLSARVVAAFSAISVDGVLDMMVFQKVQLEW
jgi:hypothetical protein